MQIQRHGGTLSITDLRELGAANAPVFREEACAALPPEPILVEIDLARTAFVDSSGLGALVLLYKAAHRRSHNGVTVRLLNPQPAVQQMLELTRMHHLFEITERPGNAPLPEPHPAPFLQAQATA